MEKQNQVRFKKIFLLFSFVFCFEEEITNLQVIKIIIHMLFPSELLYRAAICAGLVNIWSKAGFMKEHK